MTGITILPTKQSRVSGDAVEKLEHLLSMARSGEVESFIAVAFRPNNNWVMVFSGQLDTLVKIGALEAMKSDLLGTLNVEEKD